ncbi:hypothetical protein [Demequina sp.]|uniref:hypothetical protein n=1 Tax=Demequina sp. TaxID=2050685 RepID=UPI0025B90040|nr:hypothetical protein [Demequina sp.]
MATLTVLALAACSSPSGPRGVTSEEADRLSEVFFTNFDNEGAHFVLNAAPTPGTAMVIEGEVDFVEAQGYAVVSATGSDAPVHGVIFSEAVVLENMPQLVDLAATAGQQPFTWVARPFDSTAYQLDSLLGVLLGLSVQQRENPLLLEQAGVQWLREDAVNGVAVDVFEFSPQVRLWVETGGTRLLRFEGNSSTLDRPIVIDLSEPGPVTLPLVEEADVVQVADVQDLYDAVRSGA